VHGARHPGALRAPGDRVGDGLRGGAVRGPRGDPDAARAGRRAGTGGPHARRLRLAGVLAHHAAFDSLGGDLRRRRHDGALPRGVRRRRRRLREHLRPHRDGHAPSAGLLRKPRPGRRIRRRADARAHRDRRARLDDRVPAQGWSRSMITATHVSKRFGDFVALDDVSIEVATGSLTALLGPSGSGKSTLLRIIAGLERPDAGEIVLAGEAATSVPPQERGVGFVFQHYAAFKHMTVRDNIGFALKIRKRPRAEIRARVDELIELVQLRGFGHRFPAQLSGGQRQRMALARALAAEPKVLLLDEPFGALDARVRTELRTWLRRLHEETHTTTVFVTHDQEEAMEVADNVVVMNRGRVEQAASPRVLYDTPANAFVMSF